MGSKTKTKTPRRDADAPVITKHGKKFLKEPKDEATAQASLGEHAAAKERKAAGRAKAKATRAAKTAGRQAVRERIDAGVVVAAELDRLPVGEAVFVAWPGAADGTDRRRGVLDGYTKDGRPMVLVARVNAKGDYTGDLGGSPRTFERHEVFAVAADDAPDASEAKAWDDMAAAKIEPPAPAGQEGTWNCRCPGAGGDPHMMGDRDCRFDADGGDRPQDDEPPPWEREATAMQSPKKKPRAGRNAASAPPEAVEVPRNDAGEPTCVPHPACGGLPRISSISDGVTGARSYSVYCGTCNTPPHTRPSRDAAVESWNMVNGGKGRGDAVPPPSDAELLNGMAMDPQAPGEAQKRFVATMAALDTAVDKANARERTEARAAKVAETTLSCAKCGSAMIVTRAGNQRVCARCDHFEKRDVNGAWHAHSEAAAVRVEVAGDDPDRFVAGMVAKLEEAKHASADVGPQADDAFMAMLAEDELPPDEGKMPWD